MSLTPKGPLMQPFTWLQSRPKSLQTCPKKMSVFKSPDVPNLSLPGADVRDRRKKKKKSNWEEEQIKKVYFQISFFASIPAGSIVKLYLKFPALDLKTKPKHPSDNTYSSHRSSPSLDACGGRREKTHYCPSPHCLKGSSFLARHSVADPEGILSSSKE